MRYIFLIFIPFAIISCKSEPTVSDLEKIESNVREYFFMDDSVELMIDVADTLYADDLNQMIDNVDENLRLIQLDLDTLALMVDDWSYKALDLDKGGHKTESDEAKIKSLQYRIKQQDLEFKKATFVQSRRIFMRLRRSTWANIAGFEVHVHYETGEEVNDLILLLDGDFEVVD